MRIFRDISQSPVYIERNDLLFDYNYKTIDIDELIDSFDKSVLFGYYTTKNVVYPLKVNVDLVNIPKFRSIEFFEKQHSYLSENVQDRLNSSNYNVDSEPNINNLYTLNIKVNVLNIGSNYVQIEVIVNDTAKEVFDINQDFRVNTDTVVSLTQCPIDLYISGLPYLRIGDSFEINGRYYFPKEFQIGQTLKQNEYFVDITNLKLIFKNTLDIPNDYRQLGAFISYGNVLKPSSLNRILLEKTNGIPIEIDIINNIVKIVDKILIPYNSLVKLIYPQTLVFNPSDLKAGQSIIHIYIDLSSLKMDQEYLYNDAKAEYDSVMNAITSNKLIIDTENKLPVAIAIVKNLINDIMQSDIFTFNFGSGFGSGNGNVRKNVYDFTNLESITVDYPQGVEPIVEVYETNGGVETKIIPEDIKYYPASAKIEITFGETIQTGKILVV